MWVRDRPSGAMLIRRSIRAQTTGSMSAGTDGTAPYNRLKLTKTNDKQNSHVTRIQRVYTIDTAIQNLLNLVVNILKKADQNCPVSQCLTYLKEILIHLKQITQINHIGLYFDMVILKTTCTFKIVRFSPINPNLDSLISIKALLFFTK